MNQNPLRESLQQAMEWLDPSTGGDDFEIGKIQKAYDLLLLCCSQGPAQCLSFQRRLRTQLVTEPTLFADWLDDQSDLCRSIIASAFLALQLMERDEVCFGILQQSIERALLVLRVIYNAPDDVALADCILESRYPLLNALFLEPLLPLSRDNRTKMWDDTMEPISMQDIEDDTTTASIVTIPTTKELLHEEETLLEMAEKEIPKDFIEKTFIFEPTHQGHVLVLVDGGVSNKRRLRIFANYGILALSCNYSSRDPTVYFLEPTTTMTHSTLSGMFEIQLGTWLCFQVDHLSSGIQWMEAIKQGICARKVALELTNEIMSAHTSGKT